MGKKLSGLRYTESDFEFLSALSVNAALTITKLELNEKLIAQDIEKKKLEELNQMKSDFVKSVSHELKTPLTSIQMFAETLVYTNLNKIVESVLSSMEYQFKKYSVELHKDICAEDIYIEGDSDAISEALINLLSNAIKYSDEIPRVKITLDTINKIAVLSAKDNGLGIDKKDMHNIFNKFFRVENEKTKHVGGVGISLSIVKDIMEHHNTEIKIQIQKAEGSTFSLHFKIS